MVQQYPHPETMSAQNARRIGAIHRQLIGDFHPAVKGVAAAGQNLLRAYQNMSRQFYAYTASLYALAYSSTDAEAPVQQQSRQLQNLTEVLKNVHAEQIKWMEYFTATTLTTSRNCKTEKERLKALQSGFAEREGKLIKAVDRGKQTPATLDRFYAQELETARDQQLQRYRFFVDKHMELLRRWREWMHTSMGLMEGFGSDGEEKKEEDEDSEAHLDELVAHAEQHIGTSSRQEKKTEADEHDQQQVLNSSTSMTKNSGRMEQKPRQNVTNGGGGGGGGDQQQRVVESQERVLAELTRRFEAVDRKRRPFPPDIFRPTPILSTTCAQQQNQQRQPRRYRHSVGDAMLLSTTAEAWRTSMHGVLPAAGQCLPRTPLLQYYQNGPSCSSGMNGTTVQQEQQKLERFKLPRVHPPPPVAGPLGQRTVPSIVVERPSAPTSPLALYHHSRGQSLDSVASSITRQTPPTFAASDYGRLVECVTSYSAQGENQLSMEVGDRVVLVKSGTRGWVLGRSTDGTRNGWFPAKYLKLV